MYRRRFPGSNGRGNAMQVGVGMPRPGNVPHHPALRAIAGVGALSGG